MLAVRRASLRTSVSPWHGASFQLARLVLAGLLRLEFLDILLGIGVELVAAAGAADVERLALVADRHRAEATADHAFLLLLGRSQALADLRRVHPEVIDPQRFALVLVVIAVDETDAVAGEVHHDLL